MRKLAFLVLLGTVIATGAQASDLRMTVEQPHFTCEGRGGDFSRVAYHPGETYGAAPASATDPADDAAPLPCCDGKIGCAQFLSTNTIVRQSHEWHG